MSLLKLIAGLNGQICDGCCHQSVVRPVVIS